MKMERLIEKTAGALPSLGCPLCGQAFSLQGGSLICTNGHCYDMSKKGYINLAPAHSQLADKYSDELFDSRGRILAAGFYRSPMEAVRNLIRETVGESFTVLDAGCGEGAWSRDLSKGFPAATVLALDLNRDAVTRAAGIPSDVHWLVGDVKRLPLKDHSMDAVLDILTPADYTEFARVLKPNGILIKAVPGDSYLSEIRQAVAGSLQAGEEYSSERVLAHLRGHADVLEDRHLTESLPLTEEQSRDFLRMTPMTFHVPQEVLSGIRLKQITLDLHILCCKLH